MKHLGIPIMSIQREIDFTIKEGGQLQAIEISRISRLAFYLGGIFLKTQANILTSCWWTKRSIELFYRLDDRQLNDIGLYRRESVAVVKSSYKRTKFISKPLATDKQSLKREDELPRAA